jgi:hypothetical protein
VSRVAADQVFQSGRRGICAAIIHKDYLVGLADAFQRRNYSLVKGTQIFGFIEERNNQR